MRRQKTSQSVKVKIQRPDGTERVRKIGNEDPVTCNHHFIKHEYKRGKYRERCPKCGKYRKVSEEVPEERSKGEIGWSCIPQKTFQNVLQVASEVKDWKNFGPPTVERILKNEKSAAWSYYAALTVILNIMKQGKKKELYVQPVTLRKMVTLFEKLNCEDLDWRDIRSTLKSSFGKCSRITAKTYHAVMMKLIVNLERA